MQVTLPPHGARGVATPIAEPFEIGPTIDVVPYVNADGVTIQMTVLPTVREFLSYDDPGLFALSGQMEIVDSVPLPKFRGRQIATMVQVFDGQTLVLGAGTARHMEKKQMPDGKITTTYTDKDLFFFITPRIIDAAGNPVDSEAELPFAQQSGPEEKRPVFAP